MLNIQQTLSNFTQLNILIIGDIMLDHYINGSVNRISPEAPVPIIDVDHQYYRLGGAANVALNVQSLGATPYLCGVIGMDEDGFQLVKLLQSEGIASTLVYRSSLRRTTCKTRVLSQNQQLFRIDQEDRHDLELEDQESLLQLVKDFLGKNHINALLFQDYNKGVLSLPIINTLLQEAWKREIPTIVDPKEKNFFAYKRVNLFKPNLREINQQVKDAITTNILDLRKASQLIRQQLSNRNTLITLSDKGLFFDDGQLSKIIPTIPRSISDVCGAGDTVVSIAALGIALNMKMEEIAILCNLAGGQVCEKVGVVAVDLAQLMEDYNKYIFMESSRI